MPPCVVIVFPSPDRGGGLAGLGCDLAHLLQDLSGGLVLDQRYELPARFGESLVCPQNVFAEGCLLRVSRARLGGRVLCVEGPGRLSFQRLPGRDGRPVSCQRRCEGSTHPVSRTRLDPFRCGSPRYRDRDNQTANHPSKAHPSTAFHVTRSKAPTHRISQMFSLSTTDTSPGFTGAARRTRRRDGHG